MALRGARDRGLHRADLRRRRHGRLHRRRVARCQAPGEADQAARGQCDSRPLLQPAALLYGRGEISRDRRGGHGVSHLSADPGGVRVPARRAAGGGRDAAGAGPPHRGRRQGRSAGGGAGARRPRLSAAAQARRVVGQARGAAAPSRRQLSGLSRRARRLCLHAQLLLAARHRPGRGRAPARPATAGGQVGPAPIARRAARATTAGGPG